MATYLIFVIVGDHGKQLMHALRPPSPYLSDYDRSLPFSGLFVPETICDFRMHSINDGVFINKYNKY